MSYEIMTQLPRAPLARRVAAFCIDAGAIWLLSAPLSNNWFLGTLFFIAFWLAIRVLLVAKNQGQSLGRWALNLKVWDPRYQRTPGIVELSKREGLLAVAAVLAVRGISGLTSGNAAVLLLFLPLFLDWVVALVDTERYQQAFHDQVSKTLVIGAMRGYSLDLKVRWLIDKARSYMRR
ncbi:MAG: RDD family protein [Cyanobacteriota bacterium]|nr:RDD family protein [Cyanobacteriota bacterium]